MICTNQITICNPAKEPSARREKPMIKVPCNRCIACTQRKAREWAFRLWQQNKIAKNANFITLTYNDKALPINDQYTYPELNKQHVIDFMKRLRRKNEYKFPEMGKMKYYATGEYGGWTGRPHYHIILFNSHQSLNKNLHTLWYNTGDKSKLPMGNVDIKATCMETISYVAGYVMTRDIYKSDDLERKREFSIMSKGLGKNYITENFKYHQENLTFNTKFQGKNITIPEYFRKQIFCQDQRTQIAEETEIIRQELQNKRLNELKKLGHKYPLNEWYKEERNKQMQLKTKLKKDKF